MTSCLRLNVLDEMLTFWFWSEIVTSFVLWRKKIFQYSFLKYTSEKNKGSHLYKKQTAFSKSVPDIFFIKSLKLLPLTCLMTGTRRRVTWRGNEWIGHVTFHKYFAKLVTITKIVTIHHQPRRKLCVMLCSFTGACLLHYVKTFASGMKSVNFLHRHAPSYM